MPWLPKIAHGRDKMAHGLEGTSPKLTYVTTCFNRKNEEKQNHVRALAERGQVSV